jgi:putative transposase
MTTAEVERWIALEIDGRYRQSAHRGIHAVPAKVWSRAMRGGRPHRILDSNRLIMDVPPAEKRKVGSYGFQMNRLRYWGYAP